MNPVNMNANLPLAFYSSASLVFDTRLGVGQTMFEFKHAPLNIFLQDEAHA